MLIVIHAFCYQQETESSFHLQYLVELINKIIKTVKKYSMLSHGDTVLIGLSGGPDSVCLSVILDKLRDNFNISLHALYVNHGLRPSETADEEAFCQQFCAERNITFHKRSINIHEPGKESSKNIQEIARTTRLDALHRHSDELGASRVALGHNADDQAETVLMRLVRGSGPRGLAGIPAVRGKIIRPLIEIQRRDIELFLKGFSQRYMTDSSNVQDKYFRNWIRHNILHELQRVNPLIIIDICRTADIVREEDDYLDLVVTKTLMRLISRKSDSSIELFLLPLEMTERPILRRIVRRAVEHTKGLRGIQFIHIEDIINLIKTGRAGDRIQLPHGVWAIRKYATLMITADMAGRFSPLVLEVPGEVEITETGTIIKAEVVNDSERIPDNRDSAAFDYDLLEFPLSIRSREKGDIFYPAGFGKRKKLQDFFVDQKVPRDERDDIPIVVSNDTIIWVAGYRADERVQPTEKSKNIVLLSIIRKG